MVGVYTSSCTHTRLAKCSLVQARVAGVSTSDFRVVEKHGYAIACTHFECMDGEGLSMHAYGCGTWFVTSSKLQ